LTSSKKLLILRKNSQTVESMHLELKKLKEDNIKRKLISYLVFNIVKATESETKVLHEIIDDLKSETTQTNELASNRQKSIEELNSELDQLQRKYDKIHKLMYGRLDTKKK
jgi:hypothetical protein